MSLARGSHSFYIYHYWTSLRIFDRSPHTGPLNTSEIYKFRDCRPWETTEDRAKVSTERNRKSHAFHRTVTFPMTFSDLW